MKIEVNRKEFLSSAQVGGSMAGRVKTLPILDCMKCTVKGNNLVMSSFDNETAITKRMNLVSSEGDCSFCIVPKDVMNFLKTLNEENVSFEIDENAKTCVIRHAHGSTLMPILPSSDFPSPAVDSEARQYSFNVPLFIDWVKRSKDFVANDQIRPILNGVYIYIKDGEFGVAASNANKLFSDNVPFDGASVEESDVLSSNAISAVVDMLYDKDEATISFGEKNLVFTCRDARVSCRKIEGKFPNFKMIIPQSSQITIEVDRESLINSVNRAVLSAEVGVCLLRLHATDGKLIIDSEDLGFGKKAHEECECTISGDDIVFGLNGQFMLSCLNSIDSEVVSIRLNSPKTAVLFGDMEHSNRNVLLMPIAVKNK